METIIYDIIGNDVFKFPCINLYYWTYRVRHTNIYILEFREVE